MRTTAGEPRVVPHPRASPGHPREPHADSPVLPGFSATAATDQGRTRSFDHPHLWRRQMRPACAGHAPGTEGRHRGGGSPPRIAVRVRRAAIRRGRPSRQQRQAPPGQPGQPGARRPGAQPRSRPRPATRPGAHRVAASPARVADREAGPAASSQPLIRRSPVTAGVASACARVRVVKGAGAPLVSGGRSGKTGKDGAVRVWLAGVAGACPRVRHRWGSRLWSSSSLVPPLGPLGITRLGQQGCQDR